MAENIIPITTCRRFVAFFDIMGFKELVLRKNHKEINKMFDALVPPIETIKKNVERPWIQHITKSPGIADNISFPSVIYPVLFSDSIILISDDDTDISAMFMFEYTINIIKVAMEKGIPIKGAISCGEMTVREDKSIYFGQPIIDAFELHNELKIYGVVLHYTCEKRLNELETFKTTAIVKYPVPIKSTKITHNLIDWTDSVKQDPEFLANKFYSTVSGPPRKYVDNTIVFLKWLKEVKAKNPTPIPTSFVF